MRPDYEWMSQRELGGVFISSRLPGGLTEPRPVRTTDTTSHTTARSGLGPVVGDAGETEPGWTQARPQGAPGGDRSTSRVTQCDQGWDGQEAQRRLPGGGHK